MQDPNKTPAYYLPEADPIYPFSNRPLITWDIDYAMMTTFECDVELLRRVLPAGLRPMTARPGVGLFVVTFFRYYPWQQRLYPDLYETIFCVQVIPDLTWGVPTLALYVASFGSNDLQFLADERTHNLFPTYDSALEFEVDETDGQTRCWDADGPLYTIVNTTNKRSMFTKQDLYVQVYVEHGGHLHVSHNTFRGQAFQHQDDRGGCVIHDHPFFLGAGVGAREPSTYLQMYSPQGGDMRQMYYWRPERVDGAGARLPRVDPSVLSPEQGQILRQFPNVDNIPRGLRIPIPG